MLSKSCVLVIGGCGFLGSSLVKQLRKLALEVRTLDLVPEGPFPDVFHWNGSFLQQDVLHEAMDGVDIVYHLAATSMPRESNQDPHRDCIDNVAGSISILDAALTQGVRRIIFASSGGTVYGPTQTVPISEDHPTFPITAYGISKLSIEKYMRFYNGKSGLSTISLRIANPYGPNQNIKKAQGALTTFCYNVVHGLPITIWGNGEVERDFVHVGDVGRALISAAVSEHSGTEVNVGSGVGHSLNQILDILSDLEGSKIDREYDNGRQFDVEKNYLDINKAKELLNWTPEIDIQQGIAQLLHHFRAVA